MSHSFKHFPAGTWISCKSQHKGKKKASRRFRHKVAALLHKGQYSKLPIKSIELTSTWDLGGDGKSFYGFYNPATLIFRGRKHKIYSDPSEWWSQLMRK